MYALSLRITENLSFGETEVILEGNVRNRETNLGDYFSDGVLKWVSFRIFIKSLVERCMTEANCSLRITLQS